MNRICASLANAGYVVQLVGRKLTSSKPLSQKIFSQKRLFCFFTKGKLFYVEYNLRLFFFLLFQNFDILCGIDLDTIFPAFLIAKIKKKSFVYDAHEYFTEMEEVVTRPGIKKAWEKLEGLIVPKIRYAYTVSESYAEMFEKKYKVKFIVIRNATVLQNFKKTEDKEKYILYQGSVNMGRGLENLVEAMCHIDCKLYICGKGDILESLKMLAAKLNLEEKIKFLGFVEPEFLKEYTSGAIAGITLFSNKGLSNHFSLANRFFDYMHSGVPQIAMSYPEYKNFCSKYEVALLIDDITTSTIVNSVNRLLSDSNYYQKLQQNCMEGRAKFNWQNEEKKLLEFYQKII